MDTAIAVELDGETAILRVAGDLDAAMASCLETAVEGVIESGPRRIALDLRDAAVADAPAAAAIGRCVREGRRTGVEVVIHHPEPAGRR